MKVQQIAFAGKQSNSSLEQISLSFLLRVAILLTIFKPSAA